MAPVRRHGSRLLRATASLLLCCLALCAARSYGQVTPASATSTTGPPTRPFGQPSEYTPLPSQAAPVAGPQERVIDIRVIGNNKITREKVLANIGTRIDRPFDQVTYERDIRKLSSKNWFVHVQPHIERVPGGVVITLEVVERPIIEHVYFQGNQRIKSAKTLSKEANIKKGDPLDPYAIQDGARKLESFYQTKGFNDVKVTVVEGTKPGDRNAVYLINEGLVQKFSAVKFEGNSYSVAPDGRLRTLVQSKKPFLGLFKGNVDRKKIDEDVEKLTVYYRGLGFFKAHVGRDYRFNEKEDRMELVFYITEGPRYRVRNISFIGNKVFPEEALTTDPKLKPGDYFDQTKMNTDSGNIKDLYGSHGYVFAEAVADLRFFEEPGELDIVYQVTEGNQYRIGDINIVIKGDSPHTRYSTVLNRLSMRPGDIADIRQFRSSERRLKASGLYNVDPSKGDVPKIVFSPPDSEEGIAAAARSKRRASAKRTGNPDSFRGQSPEDSPANPPAQAPPAGQPLSAGAVVRGQSPDAPYGGYGGGYGGQGANPIPPGPRPYAVNQPYGQGPPAGNPYAPPGNSYTAGQPYGGAPAGNSYQPPYGQGGPTLQPPPPGIPSAPNPLILPRPGDVLGTNPPPDLPQIPVEVVVNEAQTGKFMFGAGVNSNAGLVGSIVLDEQNFDLFRVPTSWEDFRSGRAFRGDGQKFRIEAAPGTQVSRYLFNFADPYIFDTPVSYGLSGYYFKRFYRDWTEQRVGGRTSLGYQFTPDLSGNISLRAEDVKISQPRVLGVPQLDAVLGHTQLYSVKAMMAHDTRDSTFLPTQGHYLEADFEYSMGTFQFPRYTINARQHIMLRERPDGSGRHTLSLYNQTGFAGADTPIYETFYAGGFSTLRGFQFRGASPQVNTVLVGGDLMFVNSIEYMFPITADDMLKGVAFVDFGTVEQNIHINWRDFRVAPGLGLRVTVPMISLAPIALDFAVPVQSAPGDLKQVFSFFVGVGH